MALASVTQASQRRPGRRTKAASRTRAFQGSGTRPRPNSGGGGGRSCELIASHGSGLRVRVSQGFGGCCARKPVRSCTPGKQRWLGTQAWVLLFYWSVRDGTEAAGRCRAGPALCWRKRPGLRELPEPGRFPSCRSLPTHRP